MSIHSNNEAAIIKNNNISDAFKVFINLKNVISFIFLLTEQRYS